MIKYALVLSLIGAPALALEETVEVSSEGVFESTSAATAGSTIAEVSTTLAAVTIVATTIYFWNAAQTRRAYRRAADEAHTSLSERNERPLSSSAARGPLRAVAELERELLRRDGKDPAAFSEVDLARLIITHADVIAAGTAD